MGLKPITEEGLKRLFANPRTKDEAGRLIFGQDENRRVGLIQARLREMLETVAK